jgi:hypothetical protein
VKFLYVQRTSRSSFCRAWEQHTTWKADVIRCGGLGKNIVSGHALGLRDQITSEGGGCQVPLTDPWWTADALPIQAAVQTLPSMISSRPRGEEGVGIGDESTI